MEDHKVARKLYNELIIYDVERGGITLELLKLARDTGSATLNVTNRVDPIERQLNENNQEVKEKLKGEKLK